MQDRPRSRRLAKRGHRGGIAPEIGGIGGNPFQSEPHVVQTAVRRGALPARHLAQVHEPQRPHPVIHRCHHHLLLSRQPRPVVKRE